MQSPNDSKNGRPRLALFEGLLPFHKSGLSGNIMAGITLAALGIPDHQSVDGLLGHGWVAGALADEQALGPWRQLERFGRN